MLVIKRDGRRESVKFDKITARIEKLCYGLDTNYVSSVEVAKKVIVGIYDGVTTVELDNLAAETAATLTVTHPDYAVLAARIAISNLHKVTSKSFSNTMKRLYTYVDPRTGENASLIAKDVYAVIKKNAALLDSTIIYSRDYSYDYFGFKTLERSYLIKLDGKIVERPQHMLMRVAVGIHKEDIESAIETYNLLSEKWFTHATPTLFNAGTPKPQMSSCFVAGTKVFTVNDGVKNIEDVVLGDQVITHRGNVKPVVQLHKNPLNDRQLYKLKTFGSPSVSVTGNHRVWSVSQEQLAWGETPQWNSVEYLREGDYVAIPDKQEMYLPEALDMTQFVPRQYGNVDVSYETDDNYIYPVSHWTREHQLNESDTLVRVRKKHNAVKKSVLVDRDFAFFVGAWLGDGHIVTGRDAKKEHTFIRGIGITVHHHNRELIAKLETIAEELFGIKPYTTLPNSTNTVSVIINSHVVGRLFYRWFGKGFANKKLPTRMYRWDRPMVQAFMEGLVTTDGCVTKCGDVRITMSNIPLVKSIFALCRGVNLAVSYSQARKLKQGGTQLTARIALPKQSVLLDNVVKVYDDGRLVTMRDKEAHASSIKEIDGRRFLRISKKEKSHATPPHVYTLGIQDDHSYVVEGMVVENCFLLTMQDDSIDGIYDTLKQCAQISQSAGGIGLSIHNVRATGSYIRGTNGTSNGIVPMLRNFDMTARYVDQCFHPDTIVYTKQGVKRIDDIAVGEEMLTEDGQYNQVAKLLRSDYQGKMISLDVKQSIEPVRVTPEHPFLVLRNQQKMVNFNVIRNRLEKGYAEPEWIEAKELNENDLIAFPAVSNHEQDILEYSQDDCRFYGLMVGDGHVAKDGRAAHITMNKETDDVNFVRRYLYENGIHYTLTEQPEDRKIRFTWSAHLGFKFNRAMLYDADGQKIVHHSMLHLPKEKTLAVIQGVVEADGCITKRDNYEIMLEMTSRNVIESVRFMLMRFGILTCGYPRDRRGNISSYKNITSQQKTYCLRLPRVEDITELFDMPEGKYVSYLQWGKHCFSRVKDIKIVDYEGVVVDFEVLPNHNYVTHAGVAHNGGGKRKGSFAIYLEPWHADVFEFLHLKKNHGKEELRARDLFYALWIPDLFMKRVESNGQWSLFDPNECPGLYDTYGEDFERLYEKYEREGKARRTIRAQDLWFEVLESQTETGTPYMLYKDAANQKSNQKNLGTIRSSNLCCIAGDQRVPTQKGMMTIRELYEEGTENLVVGREKIETASEMYLPRPNAEIVNIVTQEGYTHKVTPDHKVWVTNVGWREAQHLQSGDQIAIQQFEGLWGEGDYADEAFLAGLIAGDGTFTTGNQTNVHLDIWGVTADHKEEIEQAVSRVIEKYESDFDYDNLTGGYHAATYAPSVKPVFRICKQKHSRVRKYRLSSSILCKILAKLGFTKDTKLQIPEFVWKGNRHTASRYLEGLYLADATVQGIDNGVTTTSLASTHKPLLRDLQVLWANFGVKASINQMRDCVQQLLPDGKGGQKLFDCRPLYRLLVTSIQGCRVVNEVTRIGHYRRHTEFLKNLSKVGYQQKMHATFDYLEQLPNEDAYCLIVDSEEHSWTVNGMITKNTEILEYTSKDEVAVCNLASIALPKFITEDENGNLRFDHQKLYEITKVVTRNLNKVIDVNYYPVPEAKTSNMRHRPIGIGIQGLADAFIMLRMPFESDEARGLNKDIFETIYYAAMETSMELATKEGAYKTYEGSPVSQGIFQFDMWNVTPDSGRWDWNALKKEVKKNGVRNSLLLAPMPTASTSQILGNNECFEPYTSNIYTRRVLSGEFIVVNKHLLRDLVDMNLWNENMKNRLISENGSIQNVSEIPQHLKDLYKTTWEISQKTIIDMAAERGAYICQSQSLNIHMEDPNFGKLTSMHFYAWKNGLKTGMYYLRTKAATDAIKFTVDKQALQKEPEKVEAKG